MGYFSLGRVGCVLEGFAVAFFGIASLCTIGVISVERYIVVCYPMGAVLFQTSRDAGNMSYIIIYFCVCFAVPFSIIMVSYSRLLWTLRQVTKLQVSEAGSTNRVEAQVACMVVVMVLAFLVTWLPYAAMALAVIIDSSLYIDPVVATIPVYLAKSSTLYNPIIYVFMNRQFAKGFQAMFDILLLHWGRHTRPAVPHSIHKTTLAISPELKECATRPQAVANCSSGNIISDTDIPGTSFSVLKERKRMDSWIRGIEWETENDRLLLRKEVYPGFPYLIRNAPMVVVPHTDPDWALDLIRRRP
ncbi:hypothetical protein INR49_009119 [Caranx melampygus]|nr:hypothetical protein INR49_009119 [Caranx melampygus]